MGRKRADKTRPDERREAVWAKIRELKRFTVRDLYMETGLTADPIRDYVTGLERAGYLTRERGRGLMKPDFFTLVKDIGIEAPSVRKDGTEVTAGRGREQMWRTMRILDHFTPRELAVNASTETHAISELEARTYISYLFKAGYLVRTQKSRPGGSYSPGAQARYRFVGRMHTGPKPPMIQRIKQVYDPNLKKVMWRSGGDDNDR